MLLSNPNFVPAPEIVFYDSSTAKRKHIDLTVDVPELAPKKTKSGDIDLYDYDVEPLLQLLKQRLEIELDSLYIFIGMLEGALGGKSVKYHYKWKMPVHTFKPSSKSNRAWGLEGMTIREFFDYHDHVPKHVMDSVLQFYKQKLESLPPVKQEEGEEPESELEPLTMSIIGNQVLAAGQEFLDESYITREIYQFVLSYSTFGAIQTAVDDINQQAGKNFTIELLIESPQVRHKFAQYVAAKTTVARTSAQSAENMRQFSRVFISPSFLHRSAQSKWIMAAHMWFKGVFKKGIDKRAVEAYQTLRQHIVDSGQFNRAEWFKLWRLMEKTRPRLGVSK